MWSTAAANVSVQEALLRTDGSSRYPQPTCERLYWPSTTSSAARGAMACSTLSFSVRICSAESESGCSYG